MALQRLHEDYPEFAFEVVGISEISKPAIAAYKAVHGDHIHNYGDITKIDWSAVSDFDLLTYSFPCQDISTAGRQRGLKEGSGTRSSLLWECVKAIDAKHPKYLLMENVKALVNKNNRPDFQKWIDLLAERGYRSFWQVMNAKHYGVPQNREEILPTSETSSSRPKSIRAITLKNNGTMIDYENLPDIAGLDGLMSIFPRDYPVSHSELFTLWQLHQQSTIPYTYHEPR